MPALFAIGELNERKNSRILLENEMTKSTIYNEVIPIKIGKFRSLPFWSTCFSSESPDFTVIILHFLEEVNSLLFHFTTLLSYSTCIGTETVMIMMKIDKTIFLSEVIAIKRRILNFIQKIKILQREHNDQAL